MRYLPIGIEIRSSGIRAAKLAQDAVGFHLVNYVETPVPPGCVAGDGSIINEPEVASALASSIRSLGYVRRIGARPSAISAVPQGLSEFSVFERAEIRDPRRARRNAMFSAAEFAKRPPLDSFDRCSVSATVIGPGTAKNSVRYLVTKTLRETLLARQRIFAHVKVDVTLEHEAFALARAVPAADAIIEIGASRTLLIVPGAEGVPICRSFTFGGTALAERVARGASVEMEAAEARVFHEGISADDAANWLTGQFVTELQSAFMQIATKEHIAVGSVVLTGAGARVPGVRESIERGTMTPVRIAALEGIKSDGIPPLVLADLGSTLTTSVGLALWGASKRSEAVSA